MNIAQIITNSLTRIKNYALSKFSEVDVTSNWQDSGTFSDIENKPTSMPANGGNADTVATYKLWAGTEEEYNNAFLDANTIYLITEVQQLGISDLSLTSQTRNSSGKLVYVLQWKVNNPSNETLTFKLSTNGGTLTAISPKLTNGTYSYTNSSLNADNSHTLYIQVTGSAGGSAQTAPVNTKIITAAVTSNTTLKNGYYLSSDPGSGTYQKVHNSFQANNRTVSTTPIDARTVMKSDASVLNIVYNYTGSAYNVQNLFEAAWCDFWDSSTGIWRYSVALEQCITKIDSKTIEFAVYSDKIEFGSTAFNSMQMTVTIDFQKGNGTWNSDAKMSITSM